MDSKLYNSIAEAYTAVYQEGVRDVDPEKGTVERKAKLEKKRGMKLDDHPEYKKEEVEVAEARKPGESPKEYAARMTKKHSGGKSKTYDPMKDPNFDHDKAERTRGSMQEANLKKEELEASGLFTEEEINAILEADEQFDEAMSSYDRNRKRAAQRAAERNAARAAGKTGVVPGVGYVSPRKERETYVDSAGTTRHKSGAKMP